MNYNTWNDCIEPNSQSYSPETKYECKQSWTILELKSPVIKPFKICAAPKITAVIQTARQVPNEDEAPWNSMSRHISSSLIPTIKVLMITNRRTRVGGRPVNKTNTNMKRRNMAQIKSWRHSSEQFSKRLFLDYWDPSRQVGGAFSQDWFTAISGMEMLQQELQMTRLSSLMQAVFMLITKVSTILDWKKKC